MTIEYSPVDVACNLRCDYCYENPMRDAGNISGPADWDRVKLQLLNQNYHFSLHGGEPLLAPISHIEEVFRFGHEQFGRNGIQTNGTLITDEHIRLFQIYKVGVGISIDGPVNLNRIRQSACSTDTDALTRKSLEAIEKLCEAKVVPSLIVTVHKLNGLLSARRDMFDWFSWLEKIGVYYVNLHMLEVEPGMESLAMSERENIGFFSDVYHWSRGRRIQFQPFQDIATQLAQKEPGKTSCIWHACDPLTTRAVQGISRSGVMTNCGRTNKDGVPWVKARERGVERYRILHLTPQEHGGCKDCRYFAFCKGNCPGEAIDGDWRNRTSHCETWYYLFDVIERDLVSHGIKVVTDDEEQMKKIINDVFLEENTPNMHVDTPHSDYHGDSDHKGVEVTWLND